MVSISRNLFDIETETRFKTVLAQVAKMELNQEIMELENFALITPAVVPKRHTLFQMTFWNSYAGLNMCRAVLNVEHIEGRWGWLSFNINFYKDGTPQAPIQVCTHVCIIFAHTGAGVIIGIIVKCTIICWTMLCHFFWAIMLYYSTVIVY